MRTILSCLRQHDGFIEILESTDVIRDRRILSRQADPPCPAAVPQVPGSKTTRMARATYISQNQIVSKVHSPDSPSASKEVGRDTPSTMQALIPVFAILGVTAGAQLTLLPYAYLADPLPMYHQSQDTRAGIHTYSYAGGPSAKEEVRDLDGVTRGSYSYVDAHGILQSVFYVADEGGFRVAATNLPTDGNLQLETSKVLLARYAHPQELVKAATEEEKGHLVSRRKRSLEASTGQDHQTENPSSQEDQADRDSAAIASPKSSHELPAPEEKSDKGRVNRDAAGPIVAPVYGLLDSVLIPRLTGAATSHQSRVDVHNNIRLKAVQPIKTIGVLSEPAETVIFPSQVPLATSHQSRVQVHNSLRVEVPEKLVNVETIEVQPQIAEAAAVKLEPLSLVSDFSDYNENRIQLHRNLGLEGSNRKDAVKIDAAQLAIESGPVVVNEAVPVITKQTLPVLTKESVPVVVNEAVPVVAKQTLPVLVKEAIPVVVKEALPVVTAISNQNRIQIHRHTKLEAVPITSEPTLYWATSYARPISTWPILTPIAQSSQYRHQIHSNEKIEFSK
ncbi:CUO6 protein, partial [Pseudoatta argentina]